VAAAVMVAKLLPERETAAGAMTVRPAGQTAGRVGPRRV
jgi:hypothetical protein